MFVTSLQRGSTVRRCLHDLYVTSLQRCSTALMCLHVCDVIAALLDSPQVLIAEEEKIIVEEMKGNETVVEEKLVSALSSCYFKVFTRELKL